MFVRIQCKGIMVVSVSVYLNREGEGEGGEEAGCTILP